MCKKMLLTVTDTAAVASANAFRDYLVTTLVSAYQV